jgi:hypothetical protein
MDVAEKIALELSPAEAFTCFSPVVYIAWVMVPRSYAWTNVDNFPVYTQTRYYAQWLGVYEPMGGYRDELHSERIRYRTDRIELNCHKMHCDA